MPPVQSRLGGRGLGYALDNLTLDEEMKKKYDKVKPRFMENGYYKPNR